MERLKKKSEVKQISLTFKCKSDLEMQLYNHLMGKMNRGAYIKELLLKDMMGNTSPSYSNVPVNPEPVPVNPEPVPVNPEPIQTQEKPKIKRGLGTLSQF